MIQDNKKTKHFLLKEALVDLSKEISRLKIEKGKLIKDLEKIESLVASTHKKESNLRSRIYKLSALENKLTKVKVGIVQKTKKIKLKMNKISKIKDELTQID